MDSLYIVVPAYNEEENISKLVDDWYPVIESHNADGKSRLVVIDDGSKDSTFKILTEIAHEKPLLQAITKQNAGHGSTVLFGYRYALKHNADYVFQTDSDGQTNPNEFEQFWKNREVYDAIIGNRTVRGDGRARKFIENTVCFLLRVFFDVKVQDANAPFRLMSSRVLRKYIDRMPESYNLPNIMLTCYFVYYKEKVLFKEITFKPRQGGTNSINIKKIMKIGWHALRDFYKFRKEMKGNQREKGI